MYPAKTMIATACSYTGILSLLFMITLSSVFNSPALAQQTMTTSSSGLNRILDFGSMNLVNDILNSSSLSATLGMSIVKGVKVTGINLLQNNEVSVTLRETITNPGNTSLPGSVTVTALRLPMNLRDLMSMASASTAAATAASNKTASNNMNLMSTIMQGYRAAGNTTSFMSNPLAFLKNIQIGSSSIVNANWKVPQSVTIGFVGMGSDNKISFSPYAETADFIMVIVIPFTGAAVR
jgi:hypothetical protein